MKIITLNIRRHFKKKINNILTECEQTDIICLQETGKITPQIKNTLEQNHEINIYEKSIGIYQVYHTK